MALSLTQWQSRLVGKVTIYCGSFPNNILYIIYYIEYYWENTQTRSRRSCKYLLSIWRRNERTGSTCESGLRGKIAVVTAASASISQNHCKDTLVDHSALDFVMVIMTKIKRFELVISVEQWHRIIEIRQKPSVVDSSNFWLEIVEWNHNWVQSSINLVNKDMVCDLININERCTGWIARARGGCSLCARANQRSSLTVPTLEWPIRWDLKVVGNLGILTLWEIW